MSSACRTTTRSALPNEEPSHRLRDSALSLEPRTEWPALPRAGWRKKLEFASPSARGSNTARRRTGGWRSASAPTDAESSPKLAAPGSKATTGASVDRSSCIVQAPRFAPTSSATAPGPAASAPIASRGTRSSHSNQRPSRTTWSDSKSPSGRRQSEPFEAARAASGSPSPGTGAGGAVIASPPASSAAQRQGAEALLPRLSAGSIRQASHDGGSESIIIERGSPPDALILRRRRTVETRRSS
mmetsp:Transcript_28807/g.92214  ORF Transcript_28807/g.92214 Transcript_28807/m.92214 type:complete len:243 (-) Transcript_28807:120-848(-)